MHRLQNGKLLLLRPSKGANRAAWTAAFLAEGAVNTGKIFSQILLDLVKAFDYTVRELLFGFCDAVDASGRTAKEDVLKSLNVGDDVLAYILDDVLNDILNDVFDYMTILLMCCGKLILI